MICAYCNEDKKATREHIIPAGILELFPECNLTHDSPQNRTYPNEPVIKDVCEVCNRDYLGGLDAYGKLIISKYFNNEKFDPYETKYIRFDYNKVSRWIMKIAFNSARANGYKDYFFLENKRYMLGIDSKPTRRFSIYTGLAVNTGLGPSVIFGNFKMSIIRNPIMITSGVFKENHQFNTLDVMEDLKFYNQAESHIKYLIKLGSIQFLIIGWDKQFEEDDIGNEELYLQNMFPYALIQPGEGYTFLQRCTHAYNFHFPQIIDTRTSMMLADMTNSMCSKDVDIKTVHDVINHKWNMYLAHGK